MRKYVIYDVTLVPKVVAFINNVAIPSKVPEVKYNCSAKQTYGETGTIAPTERRDSAALPVAVLNDYVACAYAWKTAVETATERVTKQRRVL